jgi:toxin FitB
VYLIDTNVVSEARKRAKANAGVIDFFRHAATSSEPLFLSSVTVGELRHRIERIRHRGDAEQAIRLEKWLTFMLAGFFQQHLAFRP